MSADFVNKWTFVVRASVSKWFLNKNAINTLIWKAIFPLQLLVVIVITLRLTTILLGGGATWEEFHNTDCLENLDPTVEGPKINGTFEGECIYDYKFKKVLYFWCDGISWDTAGPIFQNFPSNNNLFKVKHKENPWSAWIFATFMTGKAERNMGKINNDNLMYQFYLAGMKALIGAERSRAYVFDQLVLNFDRLGAIKHLDKVTADNTRMFNWLFECQEYDSPYGCVKSTLDEAKAEDRSMFFESFILDHRVHQELTKYGSGVLALRDQFARDMLYVKAWVDANPDYLLVVVSDHGQKVSAAEVDIHGNWLTKGNEGWAMFYNPIFDFSSSTEAQPITLRTVDVAPTFWQFFSANGVSIPAESVGKVYPVTTSAVTRFKALKTNAEQIRKYMKRDNTITYPDTDYIKANEYFSTGMHEKAVVEMETYITGITEKFYEEGGRIPYKLPLGTALLYLVITVALQFGSRDSLWANARSAGYGLLASPYIAWIIIAVFFTQSSDKENRHELYAYTIPLCAFLASYTFKRLTQSPYVPQRNKGHKLLQFELLEKQGNDLPEDEDCKNTEITIPTVMEEERPFLYFDIYDKLKQRNVLDALLTFVNYIFGSQKIPRCAVDYWLMYSVVVFAVFSCFEIPFSSKRFIFEDISGLYKHPPFWRTVALSVLFLEFRWQRILLTSNLEINSEKKISLLQQLIHPAFWPLNLKTIAYFVLLVLSFDAEGSTARYIYVFTFVHIGVLLFCPTYLQRDLFLPLFVLAFVLNTNKERILLCMYAVVLHFLSNTLERHSLSNRHVLPSVFVIMIALAHFYFSVLYKLPYSMNQMNLTIPGINDVTKYPNFSLIMMGLHYMGVFLMLIPFLIRLVTPSPPPLRPFKFGYFTFGHVPIARPSDSPSPASLYNQRFVMTFLMFCASLTVCLYYVFSTSEVSDIPLIWSFMICTVAIGYGTTVVCNELMDALIRILKFSLPLLLARCTTEKRKGYSPTCECYSPKREYCED